MLKFLVAVCSKIEVNDITITECYRRINGKTELLSSTLISRLRHYVCEHQTDWDKNLLPLTYAYNVEIKRKGRKVREKKSRSKKDSDEGHDGSYNTYLIKTIVRHIGSGSSCSYVVR